MIMYFQMSLKVLFIFMCFLVMTVKPLALGAMKVYEIDSNDVDGPTKELLNTSVFLSMNGCEDKDCELTCQALGFINGKCVTKRTCRCFN